MPEPTTLLQEQYAEVLLRFRRRALPLTAAIGELARLARRPQILDDHELQSLLSRIDHAHRSGTLRAHVEGPWAGAPTGRAIAERFGVGKVKLRDVRDAYYTLHLGLPPFDADEPVPAPPSTG
ncbi:hypothetical protein ACFORH_43210 [Amycolatopsis roodepoortensis]|uniref:Uncharacterized protein n=1 Tax=Amycolatopsis roodepoortensis TaxID=700274 RepID=A0ABR9LIG7_9PSEU|nr:hypothetical protein [Amycolatopsis roodepoortensis]MBE1580448.1 hypothetical protein [Amycolatopsis roodepoortensis]